MRTNSLNLKKKIAFIASLAMLAGTAAYLPADITAQLGFGASASAPANVLNNAEATDSTATAGNIETLSKVYLTIDGKYVAVDTKTGNYKTFSSLSAINGDFEAVNVLDNDTINTPFVELNDNEPVGDAVAPTNYNVDEAATLVGTGGALNAGWKKLDDKAKKDLLKTNDTYNKESNTNYEANANAYTFKTQEQEYQTANVFKKTTTEAVANTYSWNQDNFGERTDDYAEAGEGYADKGKYYIGIINGGSTVYYEVTEDTNNKGTFETVKLGATEQGGNAKHVDLSADEIAKLENVAETKVQVQELNQAGTDWENKEQAQVLYMKQYHPEVTEEDFYVELTDTQANTKEYKKVAAPTEPNATIDPTTWVVNGVLKLTGVTFDAAASKTDLYDTTNPDNPVLIDSVNAGLGTKVVAVDGIDANITTDQPNDEPTTKEIPDKSGFEVYTLGTTKYAVKTETVQDEEGESAKITYYTMTADANPSTSYILTEAEGATVSAAIEEAKQKAYVRKVNYENADANSKKQAAVDALTLAKDADGKYASIAIPYSLVTPSSIIELVPQAAAKAAIPKTSATKITLTLDENGTYTVADKTAPIIAQTDTSNWDAAKKEFTGGAPNEGANYESFDFSGLAVSLKDDATWNHLKAMTGDDIEEVDVANVTDDDIETFVKSGSVYAKNLVTTTTTPVTPNGKFTVNLNPLTNWTVSGTGVSNGVLTMTMGSNGKATSGLITYTRSTGEKEYYILTVNNAAGQVDAADVSVSFEKGKEAVALKDLIDAKTGKAKASKETVSKTVGSSSQFVDVYTVALADNETAAEQFTLASENGTIDIAAGSEANTIESNDKTIVYSKPAGAVVDYTSPIVEYTDKDGKKGYLQIIITANYEIDVYYDNDSTKTTADTTAKVTAGTSVEKPETPTNPGYTFSGWYTSKDAKDEERVYTAGGTVQQSLEITPFTKLYAAWTENDYTSEYNANGGYWTGSVTGATVKERNSDTKATVISVASKTEGDYDIATYASAITSPVRKGYTFIGWSTDASATEAMTKEELEAARPAELDGTVTLYAVWEADENTVTFRLMKFDEKDASKSKAGTDDADYDDKSTANTGLTTAFKVNTDARYGELPTAELKGYTFEGWYKKVKTDSGAYTAVRVTSSSTLAAADRDNNGEDTNITLYAKFTQNKYNITMDLDGGTLSSEYTPAYAKFDNDGNVTLYNSKDGTVSLTPEGGKTVLESATKGAGTYYELDYWTVDNGKTSVKVQLGGIESYLKTNDAADLTITAVWKVNTQYADKGSIAFDTDGGKFYTVSGSTYTEAEKFAGISGSAKAEVAETVSKNTVKQGTTTYVLLRPGYTFTGWFADEACTTAFNFDVYPDGEEVTAYAGWKANTTTLYSMRYNLVGTDGAIIVPSGNEDDLNKDTTSVFSFAKQYMGTTGATVDASEKTIEYKGKKYVFSAKLSSGLNTKDEIYAAYGSSVPNLVTYADATALNYTGEEEYTIIEGVFVDESVHTDELGTVDDVTVDANGKVSWSAAENAVKYKVVKKIGDKTYYGKETEELSYQFGSVPKTEYKVRVVAFDKDGNKTWGKEVTITPAVDPKALGEITNVKVAADRKTVTWDAVDNAATYKVMKTINGKNYYTSEIADTTVTFGSATKGAFSVKVIAINADGTEKKWSDAVSVEKVKSALGTVGNAKVSEDGVVTWDKVEGAAYYRVFKVTAGVKRFSDKVEGTSYKLNNVPSRCRIYVVAYDGNGNYAVGPQTRISNVAKATDVTVSADGTKVSWKGNDDAVQYQVAKLINGNTFYGKKVDAATTEYTFGSVAKAGTQVFVITFNADGDTSYSDAVTVK